MAPSPFSFDSSLAFPFSEYIYGPVKGFYDKYFPDAPRPRSTMETHKEFVWYDRFNPLDSDDDILSFFDRADPQYFGDTSEAWVIHDSGMLNHVSRLSYANGIADVIGVLHSDPSTPYLDGLTLLVRIAQMGFTKEPSRLFLHGFYIHNCFMEPWVFDRGGMYSGEGFHVPSDPERFLHIVKVYSEMSGIQAGASPSFANDNAAGDHKRLADSIASQCIINSSRSSPKSLDPELTGPENVRDGCRLGFLESELSEVLGPWNTISHVTTRHTLVWEETPRGNTPREMFVVKLRWWPEGGNNEETLLELAKERKVWGIVKVAARGTFTSVRDLRAGLTFGPRLTSTGRIETQTQPETGDTPDEPNSNPNPGNFNETRGLGILGHSRPLTVVANDGENLGVLGVNPTLCWLALHPVGKPLAEYRDTIELLHALRDAIIAHRSLYQQGRILHRDITHEHILITTPEKEGDPRGILISLNCAIDLDKGPGRAGDGVGTEIFAGIGKMIGQIHTYRHDLEGFFFVFLWMMICGRQQAPPLSSKLADWANGTSFQDRLEEKVHDMCPENFNAILYSFQPEFDNLKGLAEELRHTLFPAVDGEVAIETDMTSFGIANLYQDVIYAFDKAIATEQGVGIKTWHVKHG
ncbi:hypothetical protein F5X97DRAFT_340346 [Nemania serpens]|nr:hypothetical protein F5X97DRAFT_340346 [Nemania serpens]